MTVIHLIDVEIHAHELVSTHLRNALVEGQQLIVAKILRVTLDDHRRCCGHLSVDLLHHGVVLCIDASHIEGTHACRQLIGEVGIACGIVLAVGGSVRLHGEVVVARVVHRCDVPTGVLVFSVAGSDTVRAAVIGQHDTSCHASDVSPYRCAIGSVGIATDGELIALHKVLRVNALSLQLVDILSKILQVDD